LCQQGSDLGQLGAVHEAWRFPRDLPNHQLFRPDVRGSTGPWSLLDGLLRDLLVDRVDVLRSDAAAVRERKPPGFAGDVRPWVVPGQ